MESALLGRNRRNFVCVLLSYRTFSQVWAFHPLMVSEKVAATSRAVGMVTAAMARGTFDGGADAVVRMLRQEVQANRKRLEPS